MTPACVPAVTLAVVAHVAEGCRPGGQRRQDDGDAVLAETARPDNEGRMADAAVRGVQPREVEAGRPGADANSQIGGRSWNHGDRFVVATPFMVTLSTVRVPSGPTWKIWSRSPRARL